MLLSILNVLVFSLVFELVIPYYHDICQCYEGFIQAPYSNNEIIKMAACFILRSEQCKVYVLQALDY